MDAKYCTRCKKLFASDDFSHGKIIGLWIGEVELDLCEECKEELDKFLFGK